MAEITNGFFEALNDPKAAMWSAGVAFNRSNPLPLDKWSVFQNMTEANAYAESNAVAYPGQLIAVYDNGKMSAYVLAESEADGKLVPQAIGVIPTGEGAVSVSEDGKISIGVDGVTIEVGEDNKLHLVGFPGAPEGAQLLKQNGKLAWVKPDTTTVEGLNTTVESLDTAINGTKNEDGTRNEDGIAHKVAELEDEIGSASVVGEGGVVTEPATGLHADIENIGTDLVDLFERTEALEGDNTTNKQNIEKAQEDISTNAEDIVTLKEDVADLKLAVGTPAVEGETPEEATGLFKDIEDLDVRVNDVESDIVELNGAIGNVYTKNETHDYVAEQIAAADHLKYKVVSTLDDIKLDEAGADRYIYLVPVESEEAETNNVYDEYMVIENQLELVGQWKVDLSEYSKTTEVEALVKAVDDKVTAHENAVNEALADYVTEEVFNQTVGTDSQLVKDTEQLKTDVGTAKEDIETLKEDVSSAQTSLDNKVDKLVEADGNKSYVINEATGSGNKFVYADGSEAFVGVHSNGASGLMAQIYANDANAGSKINVYNEHVYYVRKEDAVAGVADNAENREVAVKGDLENFILDTDTLILDCNDVALV